MKKEERLQKEKEYLEKLKKFDLDISNDKILGIDEVGRGPYSRPSCCLWDNNEKR